MSIDDRFLALKGDEGGPIQKREMLQAHINTLDTITGAEFRQLVEDGWMGKLEGFKNLIRLTFTNEVPAKIALFVLADLYRDMIEAKLKGLK